MRLLAAMFVLLLLGACAGQGTFAKAGRNADRAIDNVHDGVSDVVDDVRDGAKDVHDDVKRNSKR
jgi:hypothetical protein